MLIAELFLEGGEGVQSKVHLPSWPQIYLTRVGGERFIIQSGAKDGEAPVTSSLTVSPIGNFSLPLTEKTTGSFFFPSKTRETIENDALPTYKAR